MRPFTLIAFFVFSAWCAFAHAQDERPVLQTSINGMRIGGLEFWPFTDERSFNYPDDVRWDYSEGSEKAKQCMLESNRLLVSWLNDTNSPVFEKLTELKRRGGPSQFWMWVNDYSTAPQAARNMRRSHVWHWCSQHTSPDCGWLKFESSVKPDGSCVMPVESQVVSYLQGRINTLPEPLQPDSNVSGSNVNDSELDDSRDSDGGSSPSGSAAGGQVRQE